MHAYSTAAVHRLKFLGQVWDRVSVVGKRVFWHCLHCYVWYDRGTDRLHFFVCLKDEWQQQPWDWRSLWHILVLGVWMFLHVVCWMLNWHVCMCTCRYSLGPFFVPFECLSVLANKLKFRSCLRIFVRFEYVSTRFRGWLSVVLPDAIRMDVMWDYFGHSPKKSSGVLTVLRRSQEGTNMLWLLAECVGTDIVGAMGFRIMNVKAF